jgi:hypothetical protein
MKKHQAAYIPVNITRKEAQEIFEHELKLMGLEFTQRYDNHNIYNIKGKLNNDVLRSMSIKWYIRDLTMQEAKLAEKTRKLRKAMHKKIAKIFGVTPIQMGSSNRKPKKTLPPEEITIIEFMGPKL